MTTNYSAQNKERYGTVAMIIKHRHNGVKIFMEPQFFSYFFSNTFQMMVCGSTYFTINVFFYEF